jgi:hypothetical protein
LGIGFSTPNPEPKSGQLQYTTMTICLSSTGGVIQGLPFAYHLIHPAGFWTFEALL